MQELSSLIGRAILAKRLGCPRCGVPGGVSCREEGRQRIPLAETHDERMALAVEQDQAMVNDQVTVTVANG